MATVTVVLTSFNRPNLVRRAIDSVLAQTYADWKLLIVDDSTDDATWGVLCGYSDPRITVIKATASRAFKMCRYSTNINQALLFVSTPFVTYLTDDDFYFPTRLEAMVRGISCSEGRHVVYGHQRRIRFDADGAVISHHFAKADQIRAKAEYVVDHNSVLHCTHCCFDVNLWPTSAEHTLHADAGFWARLNGAGFKFHPVDVLGDQHHIHPNGVQQKVVAQRPLGGSETEWHFPEAIPSTPWWQVRIAAARHLTGIKQQMALYQLNNDQILHLAPLRSTQFVDLETYDATILLEPHPDHEVLRLAMTVKRCRSKLWLHLIEPRALADLTGLRVTEENIRLLTPPQVLTILLHQSDGIFVPSPELKAFYKARVAVPVEVITAAESVSQRRELIIGLLSGQGRKAGPPAGV